MSSGSIVVVLLVGPQAAGKSMVATALGRRLRAEGEIVAQVELDQIAAMALPTLPDWRSAATIFGLVAGQWTRTPGMTCVIAEGISSRLEVTDFMAHLPPTVPLVTVAVTTSFDSAWTRAREDPTRGVSRERAFLEDRYAWWADEQGLISADLVLETGRQSVAQSVQLIADTLRSVRDDRA